MSDSVPPSSNQGYTSYSAGVSDHGHIGVVGPNATVHMHQYYRAAPQHEPSWPVVPVLPPSRVSAYQHRESAQTIPGSGSVVLAGPSGFGKTQIAAGLFAESTAELRLWVPAISAESVLTAYADAAVALNIADTEVGVSQMAKSFLAWLTSTDRSWVVVLDNLDDHNQLGPTKDFPGGLWPPVRTAGLTLATTTSRDPRLRDGGRTRVDVDTYTEQEAVAYLTDRLTPALAAGELPAGALDQAAQLAADLGYHPLALGQAAALVLLDALTIPAYRVILAEQKVAQALHATADGYPQTVQATWTLANERALTQTEGISGRVQLLLAVIDPTRAPQAILTTAAASKYLNSGRRLSAYAHIFRSRKSHAARMQADSEKVEKAVRVLHRLSLVTHFISEDPRVLRTHPLNARITQENASPEQLLAALRTAADGLLELWSSDQIDVTLAGILRANGMAIAEHEAQHLAMWEKQHYDGVHPLLIKIGQDLANRGLHRAATSYFVTLEPLAKKFLGPDHPDTLDIRRTMANWRGEAGEPAAAAQELEALTTQLFDTYGEYHPATLGTLTDLARWCGESGDAAGAAKALEDLVADQTRIWGADHSDTLSTRNHLANWLGQAGNANKAVTTYQALLEDQLRLFGSDDPDTLIIRGNLASWRGLAGDAAGAAAELEELLVDFQRLLGPNHPHTFITRDHLANWLGKAGDPTGAVTAYEDLLADQLRVLGPDHPDSLKTRHNLACRRGYAGRIDVAIVDLQDVLVQESRVLGRDHPNTLRTRAHLAKWLGKGGDPPSAVVAYEELLADQQRALGLNHGDTFDTRSSLAHWRGEAGNPASAATTLQHLINDRIEVLGPDHPTVATDISALTYWQGQSGGNKPKNTAQ